MCILLNGIKQLSSDLAETVCHNNADARTQLSEKARAGIYTPSQKRTHSENLISCISENDINRPFQNSLTLRQFEMVCTLF